MTSQFPQTFGPYVLDRFIAAGGMAEVFLARSASSTGPICVKRMLPEMTKNEEYVTMFKDEAALSQRLLHPNIVRVFDFGEIEGRMYMAMEYVDGMDVGSLLRRLKQRNEALAVADALRVGIDLCAGLAHAHTLLDEKRRPLKLIHRDVSPQNILLSSTGAVKVTDFGIAKAIGRETKTATGMIKGKVAYMAPEQALGQYIDQRVDQFAAGIVIWEMVTGARLFNEKSDILTFEKIIRQPTPRPSAARPGLPPVVDSVILRALAKSPDERYPDLQAFCAALSQALVQVGGKPDLARAMAAALGAAPAQRVPVEGAARADAPTRLTPQQQENAVQRLPTGAMTPLPAQPSARSSSGMRVVTPGPGPGSRSNVPDYTKHLSESAATPFSAADIPIPGVPRTGPGTNTRSTGVLAAPADKRAAPLGLVVGALVVGLGVGFGVAQAVSKPAASGAECARPSSKIEDVQKAAEAMKRASATWGNGDYAAAAALAKEANAAHGTPAAHMMLGRVALMSGNRLEALTQFRCVTALDPGGNEAAGLERLLQGR